MTRVADLGSGDPPYERTWQNGTDPVPYGSRPSVLLTQLLEHELDTGTLVRQPDLTLLDGALQIHVSICE